MKAGSKRTTRNARRGPEEVAPRDAKQPRLRLASIVLVACAVVSTLVALDYWLNNGQVYHGVEVGEVPVGGQSVEEARAEIEENVFGPMEEIELRGLEENVSIDSERLSLSFDANATAEAAYAVGRTGSIAERLKDRAVAALGLAGLAPSTDYESEAARSAVVALAEEVNQPPRDASVRIQGPEAVVVESAEGYEMDVEETLASVERAISEATGEAEVSGRTLEAEVPTDAAERAAAEAREAMGEGIVLSTDEQQWSVSPAAIGSALAFEAEGDEIRVSLDRQSMRQALSEVYGALTVEPAEARYVFGAGNEVSVVPGETGRGVQSESLMRSLETGIFAGEREYSVPVRPVEPELTTAEAERLKPTTVLGEYQTDYTWDTDPGRRANMSIASDALTGTFVAPGETFSFNEVASPLDYEQAKVIVEGAADYADGGGVSQVSSTLYMTANMAGLEILEAHPHSAELPYIRPGLDTTVWFGALDLRFRNNTDGYIMIQQWQGQDGFNHARIYGVPTGREVTVTSEKVYDGPDASGEPITRWNAYKTIVQDGEVVEDGVFRTVTYSELEPYEGPPPNGQPNG